MLWEQVDSADQLGFTAKASSELEYFIFQCSFYETAEKGYKDLKPALMIESDVY